MHVPLFAERIRYPWSNSIREAPGMRKEGVRIQRIYGERGKEKRMRIGRKQEGRKLALFEVRTRKKKRER